MPESRIVADHRIMGGVPCIRGTRIPIATLVGLVAQGQSVEEILADYPQLSAEDGPRRPRVRRRCGQRAAGSVQHVGVRFLLDECVSTGLAPMLAAAGYDVVHVSQRDRAGRMDDVVLAVAWVCRRVRPIRALVCTAVSPTT